MTEQEKRDRVIEGLKRILHSGKMYEAHLVIDTCEAAIALLKAQEPRLMTLEEVRDEAEYMYLEKHSETGSDLYGCAIRGDWDGYGIELLMGEYDTARERWSEYGKRWRCWTSSPTDEQRRNTPWT